MRPLAVKLFARQLSDPILGPCCATQLAAFLFIWKLCRHVLVVMSIFDTLQFGDKFRGRSKCEGVLGGLPSREGGEAESAHLTCELIGGRCTLSAGDELRPPLGGLGTHDSTTYNHITPFIVMSFFASKLFVPYTTMSESSPDAPWNLFGSLLTEYSSVVHWISLVCVSAAQLGPSPLMGD